MAKKKSTRTTKSKKKNATKNPSVIWGLVVLIVVVVGAGLYFLKSSTPQVEKVEVKKPQPQAPLPPPPEEKWSYIKALETRTINTLPPASVATQDNGFVDDKPVTPSTPNVAPKTNNAPVTTIKPDNRVKKAEKPADKSQSLWSVLGQKADANHTTQRADTPTRAATPVTKVASGNFGLQCGAFDQASQAESRRAKLAMLGITAHIKRGGNWYRIFVGPIGSRDQAQQVRDRIHSQVDCFVLGM